MGVVGSPGASGVADVLQGGGSTFLGAQESYVGPCRVLENLGTVGRQGQQVGYGGHFSFGTSGASSRTTWALVPEIPKELTPARAGPGESGQGLSSRCTVRGRFCQGMLGLGALRCRLGGMVSCLRARATLIRPATPAAPSVCPMFVFTEPTTQGWSSGRPSPITAPRACISTGSPTDVPVPWASTYWTSPGETPALR